MSKPLILALAVLAAPGMLSAQSYQAAWSADGAIDFVRPVSDSTILVMSVQYAPFKYLTEPAVMFDLYAVKCGATNDVGSMQQALLSVGATETEALKVRSKEPLTYKSVSFNLEERVSARLVTGCLQIDRRKRNR